MSGAWITSLNSVADLWAHAMARACWQGGVALALGWILCRAWPGVPPRSRCWLWRLAYLKLLVAFFWVTPVDLPLLPAPPAPLVTYAPAAPQTSLSRLATEAGAAKQRGRPPGATETRSPPARTQGGPVAEGRLRAFVAVVSTARQESAVVGLMLLWLLGLGACGAQLAREWREMGQLRAGCAPVGDGPLNACCEVLCRRFGVRRAPRLLRAEGADSPLLVGVAQPAIVLPAPLLAECAAAELTLMLAHELAHLKRRDLVWSWLPIAIRGLFFFFPLVWLAEQEWRLAQEMACDELAVWMTNAPPGDYGGILVKVAARDHRQRRTLMTAGVIESYETLRRRLLAMKQMRRHSYRRMATAGGVVALLALVGMVPWRVVARPQRAGPLKQATERPGQPIRLHFYTVPFREVFSVEEAPGNPAPRRGEMWHYPEPKSALPNRPLWVIQRVIGLPGDTIEIRKGQVLVNGKPLSKPHGKAPLPHTMAALMLRANQYFVLGAFSRVSNPPARTGLPRSSATGDQEQGDLEKTDRESRFRLEQLANALTLYAEDWDAALPPMKDAATVRRALLPYVRKNDEVLFDPQTNEPYQPNPSLSGKRPADAVDRLRRSELDAIAADMLRHPHRRPPARGRFTQMRWDISSPQNTVAFYAPAPAPDGTRAVVFLDHHVTRVPEAHWPEMKRFWRVP